jgi:hypothetical protein
VGGYFNPKLRLYIYIYVTHDVREHTNMNSCKDNVLNRFIMSPPLYAFDVFLILF